MIAARIFAATTLAVALLALPDFAVSPARAQQISTERVQFARGHDTATMYGQIRGDRIIDYVANARAGQRLTVEFSPSNLSAYMNVTAPGARAAMHIGSVAGNRFETVIPSTGDYTIRVYLMRNAARRGERSDFALKVSIVGGAGGRPPDYADGDAGGPDFWEVVNVPSRDVLNLRAQASASSRIVGALRNGDVVRNRGCRSVGRSRWCNVETRNGLLGGWANGRYLRESSGRPPSGGGGGAGVPELFVRPSGEIEVRWAAGCTVLYNRRGQRVQAGSSCSRSQRNRSDDAVARHMREQGR